MGFRPNLHFVFSHFLLSKKRGGAGGEVPNFGRNLKLIKKIIKKSVAPSVEILVARTTVYKKVSV